MATRRTAPKKIDTLNDRMQEAAELKRQIAEIEAPLSALKDQLKDLEATILAAMVDSGTEQHRIDAGSYTVRRSTVPKVADWKAVDAFILKHRALDLLHRRLTATAWAERTEAGIIVPGVEPVLVVTLAWRGGK